MDGIGRIYAEPAPILGVTGLRQKRSVAMNKDTSGKDQIQGEGNYDAARKFDDEERAFVQGQPELVEQKAKEAEEALDGPEGEDLERARQETGDRGHMPDR